MWIDPRAARHPTYSQLSMNKQPLFCNPQKSPNQFVRMSNFRMMKLNSPQWTNTHYANGYVMWILDWMRRAGGSVVCRRPEKRKNAGIYLLFVFQTNISFTLAIRKHHFSPKRMSILFSLPFSFLCITARFAFQWVQNNKWKHIALVCASRRHGIR